MKRIIIAIILLSIFTACDLPACFLVADGHPNTVANGIMFNALFADVLGYTPLTDHEIAVMAGLK